ncbi:restriction endonuclease [Mesorhizobium caraganae]|uniref:restriction endonuclease n=1 Tax=Mesorhizobium caraganae TaxID=483206 RepID=UPI0017841DCD|nr:restriction endonuclease [Mesorhizobium caraganae]
MKKTVRGLKEGTTKSKGDAFERRVARYYEALGFQVSRDQLVFGHQVDILAKKHAPGVGPLTIAVEAKSRSGSLGVNDIGVFLGMAKELLERGIINAAILVTDTSITREAKLKVGDKDTIRLMGIADLEKDLFNSSESLIRVIRDYESEGIFKKYYQITAQTQNWKVPDASDYVLQWVRTNTSMLVVVGDFGSGKTTILERAFYHAAQTRLSNENSPFPVKLSLRTLRQYGSLWSFVEASLRDHQYISPPRAIWEAELEAGRLVVFMDGFDEIFTGATVGDRASYLAMLAPIIQSSSPCVLSSRPTFFQSLSDVYKLARDSLARYAPFERMPNAGVDQDKLDLILSGTVPSPLRRPHAANVLTIDQLDATAIKKAVAMRGSEILSSLELSVDEYYRLLKSMYDLDDLMRRPLLLDMILSTTIGKAVDIRGARKAGASSLYDIYTQEAARRDHRKGQLGQYLKPEQRLDACRAMANFMKQKGEIVLSLSELASCVAQAVQLTPLPRRGGAIDMEAAITDIRTCSFVRFVDDGTIAFTHRSFYEFFIAQSLMMGIEEDPTHFFSVLDNTKEKEILYFLSSFVRDLDHFAGIIREQLRTKSAGQGVKRLAFTSGVLLRHVSLINVDLRDAELSKIQIDNVHLNNVRLDGCGIREVKGASWKFTSVELDSSEIHDLTLRDSEIVAECNSLSVGQWQVDHSTLTLKGRKVTIDTSKFTRCKVRFRSGITMADVSFEHCDLVVFDPGASQFTASRVRLEDSKCYFQSVDQWLADGADIHFDNCLIGGAVLSVLDVTRGDRPSRTQVVFHNCQGILFLRPDQAEVFGEQLAALRKQNPKMVILGTANLDLVRRSHDLRRRPEELRADEGLGKTGRKQRSKKAANTDLFADLKSAAATIELAGDVQEREELARAIRQFSMDTTMFSDVLKELVSLKPAPTNPGS